MKISTIIKERAAKTALALLTAPCALMLLASPAAAQTQGPGALPVTPPAAAAAPAAPATPATPAAPAAPAAPAVPAVPAVPAAPATSGAAATATGEADSAIPPAPAWPSDEDRRQVVSIGHDATLGSGEQAAEVVAVFGSSSNAGQVLRDVVAVFGDTHVTGTAGGSAVAVFGNVYVDGEVDHDVVAVFGDVKLGPHARVRGQVVEILGTLERVPGAVIHGGTQRVLPGGHGMRTWLARGALLGRPLVLGAGLIWMWAFAFSFLVIHILLALVFPEAVDHCVTTLETRPGHSLLTAVLAVFITPLLLFLLLVTLIGIPAIPVVAMGIFCAAVFGKTTALAWIGYRCTGRRPGAGRQYTALAVLVGGLIAMAAYLVPVIGFLAFMALGMFGYGAVVYALLVWIRRPALPAGPRAGGPGAHPGPGLGASAGPGVHPGPGLGASAGPGAGAAGTGPEAATAHAQAPPFAAGSAAPGTGAATSSAPEPAAGTLGSETAAGAAAAAAAAATALGLPRAGFWIRMLALLIDAVLVGMVLALLVGWYGGVPERLQLVALAVYGAVMWKLKATTIGGIVCDLKVVRLDGREIDWPTATVRALGCLLSLLVVGLGFLWIVFDPGRQAWHDKLAGTVVVRVPRGAALL